MNWVSMLAFISVTTLLFVILGLAPLMMAKWSYWEDVTKLKRLTYTLLLISFISGTLAIGLGTNP